MVHSTLVAVIGAVLLAGPAGDSALAEERTDSDRTSSQSLGDLTGPWQLFVDDFLIAESTNVVRTFHPFDKYPGNPVAPIVDWMPGGRGTILPKEDGTGWIRFATGRATVASSDLIHWGDRRSAKPEAAGSGASVMHTPWDEGREYKMVTYQSESGGSSTTFLGYYSRDGISAWTPIETNPLMHAGADTLQFVWDPIQQRYYGTMKIWTDVRGVMRRCVGLTTSKEFNTGWSDAQMILIPDTLDDGWAVEPSQRTDFYSFSAFAYQTMYLGLLEVFRVTDGHFADRLRRDPADGHIHIELVVSRDGVHWDRIADRTPVLPIGPLGAWDGGMIKIPSQPVVDDGQIKLVYSAGFYSHGYGRGGYPTRGRDDDKETGLGLATLRKDGWASLDAGRYEGSVTTKVLRQVEGPLAINFLTARGQAYGTGWIKVEVLDEQGTPIEGYTLADCDEMRGDRLDQIVTWNGSDALPAATPVRFRFVMTDARLYSFRAGSIVVDAPRPELKVVHTFEDAHEPGMSPSTADDAGLAAVSSRAAIQGRNPDRPATAPPRDAVPGVYFQNDAAVDRSPANAAFGRASVRFGNGPRDLVFAAGDPRPPRKDVRGNGLELDGTFQLGARFTLAAQVKLREAAGRQRLFSAYDPYPERHPYDHAPFDRDGWIGTRELIFDFDASGADEKGCLRLVVNGRSIIAPGSFSAQEYHHLAATYDEGSVALYLDGKKIGSGSVPGGPVTLLVNLRVGTDSGPYSDRFQGTAENPQLKGNLDDVVVLGRALSPEEIRTLSDRGAAAFFDRSGAN